MSAWIVHEGRWTQEQMDAVVRAYHTFCGSFDGIKGIPPPRITKSHRIHEEATIVHVVEALEKAGMKVTP